MSKPVKAVGLLSGGLDSTIAAAMLMRQGIEIQGLTFYTGFCVVEHNRRSKTRKRKKPVRNEALQAGAKLDLPVEMIDISGPDYLKVLTDPKYGYGKTVNPCIDCRIFMFRRARQYMDEIGAQFMFTGEVLGQRPMSQRRQPYERHRPGRRTGRPVAAAPFREAPPAHRTGTGGVGGP